MLAGFGEDYAVINRLSSSFNQGLMCSNMLEMSTSGFLTWDDGPNFCGSDRSDDSNYVFPALYPAF